MLFFYEKVRRNKKETDNLFYIMECGTCRGALAVALNQGGGKPRPYNVGILSYTVTKYKDLLVFSVSAHPSRQ